MAPRCFDVLDLSGNGFNLSAKCFWRSDGDCASSAFPYREVRVGIAYVIILASAKLLDQEFSFRSTLEVPRAIGRVYFIEDAKMVDNGLR